VEEGVAAIKALLTQYDDVNAKLGEDLSPEEMDRVLEEQSRIQDKIDASNAWDLDSRLDLAMDALRLPPPEAEVARLSGGERRRVALCRLLLQSPDLLLHHPSVRAPGTDRRPRYRRGRSSPDR
jgi:ATPase subunit of ABC transporter with duplicated ATPase domains